MLMLLRVITQKMVYLGRARLKKPSGNTIKLAWQLTGMLYVQREFREARKDLVSYVIA